MPIEMPLLKNPVNRSKKAGVMPAKKRVTNWRHIAITSASFVLVNVVAVSGQLGWAHDHLQSWGLPGQIMFAIALESVAIAVAYHAYLAEISNDSALKLKLASYGFGICIGLLNYSHYAGKNFSPTAVAIVVGSFSALSPWLWSMYSRRISRTILKQNGLIEDHSIRLGSARWVFHPIKCVMVMSKATWDGETYAHKAVHKFNDEKEQKKLQKELANTAENVSVNGTKERVEQ